MDSADWFVQKMQQNQPHPQQQMNPQQQSQQHVSQQPSQQQQLPVSNSIITSHHISNFLNSTHSMF